MWAVKLLFWRNKESTSDPTVDNSANLLYNPTMMRDFLIDLFHATILAVLIGFPFAIYFWRM
jgi:1,2-phenylacetyl-CoA epoxidase catalytic subunit